MPKKTKPSASEATAKPGIGKKLEKLEQADKMILKRIGEISDVLEQESKLLKKEEHEIEHMEKERERGELLKKGKIEKFEVHDFTQIVIGTLVFAGPEMFAMEFWEFLEHVPTPNIVGMHLFVLLSVFITYYYRYFPFQKFDFSKLRLITKRLTYVYFPVLATVLILLFTFNVIVPHDPAIEFLRKTMIAHTVGMIGAVTFEFLVE